jgi:hypothetical protein
MPLCVKGEIKAYILVLLPCKQLIMKTKDAIAVPASGVVVKRLVTGVGHCYYPESKWLTYIKMSCSSGSRRYVSHRCEMRLSFAVTMLHNA